MLVSPATELVFKLTSREKKQLKSKDKSPAADDDFTPLSSLDQISIGMAMTYEGRRRPSDGAIEATRIELVNNDLEDGEARLWKSLKVSAKPAQGFKPGELSIAKVGKFKLLPDDGVQEYVSALGRSLIPAYQRDLPEGTPHKIPFQFHVIQNQVPNAFALPNGVIAVHSGMITLLENEAQLAAVLGHEIAHSVQEHTWRQMQYHKKKRTGLAIASAVASAYGAYGVADLLNLVESAVRSGALALAREPGGSGRSGVHGGGRLRPARSTPGLEADGWRVRIAAHELLLEQPREPRDQAQLPDERAEEQLHGRGLQRRGRKRGRVQADPGARPDREPGQGQGQGAVAAAERFLHDGVPHGERSTSGTFCPSGRAMRRQSSAIIASVIASLRCVYACPEPAFTVAQNGRSAWPE